MIENAQNTPPALSSEERDTKTAIMRGWRRTCPRCGAGPVFEGYLKVRDDCVVCQQDFTPQRADDGPAWLTMLIAGHLMAPLIVLIYELWRPSPWVLFFGLSVPFVLLSLWLLPRIKGGWIAFQWAKRMHGFGAEPDNY
ncbi:DUF983 domain-containing protein [Pontivivens insulae]|uniref:DUF983 domain-containing protein n=1 Tax=Pontivivens insulae TaxID=1639689 RepID=A0A2R8ABZ3_9RHOB|nr:DUF983 domain-containing protein [Pontivivens insulae]RED11052.1 uncharacterized protein (DUF983 family) [Pontivivens insulae]SPF29773.1 hypothetical protein POI8812_02090 [Pontivivens insulae]